MTIVADVSAVVEFLLQTERNEAHKNALKKADWVIAPELYISEISNVLWKYFRARVLDEDTAIRLIENGLELIDDFIPAKEIWREAFLESLQNNHAVYDMMYLITARRNGGLLITLDKKLAKIAKTMKIKLI